MISTSRTPVSAVKSIKDKSLIVGSAECIRVWNTLAPSKVPFSLSAGHVGGNVSACRTYFSNLVLNKEENYMLVANGNRGWDFPQKETSFCFAYSLTKI